MSKTVYSGLRGIEVGSARAKDGPERDERGKGGRGRAREKEIDRNRVRDFGTKEADEKADAPQLVSRIMVILKAPERLKCPACPLKVISPRREWLTLLVGITWTHFRTCVCVCKRAYADIVCKYVASIPLENEKWQVLCGWRFHPELVNSFTCVTTFVSTFFLHDLSSTHLFCPYNSPISQNNRVIFYYGNNKL